MQTDPIHSPGRKQTLDPSVISREPIRVLVIEDSVSDWGLIHRSLQSNARPSFAATRVDMLETAIQSARENHFDAVLLDLSLPDSYGLESAQRFIAEAPELPLVVLTGLNDEDTAHAAIQCGAQDYLAKDKMDAALLAKSLTYAIERKQLYEASRLSELRYRALVDSTTSLVWHADHRGEVSSADNSAWVEFTGQLPDGDGWINAFHESDRESIRQTWTQCCESHESFAATARLIHAATGQFRHVEIRAVPVVDQRDRVSEWIGLVHDIDEKRRAELALRRNERLASLGTFAAGIAHEVSNPLWAAQVSIQAALHNIENNADKVRECVDNANVSVKRCIEFLTNTLRFVKTGSTVRRRERLERIAKTAVDVTSAYATKMQARVHVIPPESPVEAVVNPVEIQQVFLNLIRNAIHSSDREVHVTIRIEPSGSTHARLIVADNGDGIEPAIRERVLDPFFTTKSTGTGLGLSIVHSIVEEHEGTIDIDSTLGQGTSITLEIPLGEVEE